MNFLCKLGVFVNLNANQISSDPSQSRINLKLTKLTKRLLPKSEDYVGPLLDLCSNDYFKGK